MGVTYSFRNLPPGVREEAQARGVVNRRALVEMRTEVMPRHKPMDIDRWERERSGDVIRVLTRAQTENAALVDKTYGMTLTAQGYQLRPLGYIRPEAFAGQMPDGDPLDMVATAVANRVRERLALGAEPLQAWQAGGKLLATITQTALSDASRMAKMVAGLARPRTLYVRMLNRPSCPRCVVLAGKRGFWSEPFKRHPGCDCTQVPVPMDSDDTFDGPEFNPRAYFDAMDAAEQDRRFGAAVAEAIREGADISQVVNAAGMSDSGTGFTKSGATARGGAVRYYYGPDGRVTGRREFNRMSPQQIINQTDGDPQRRVALLYVHGYLTDEEPGQRTSTVITKRSTTR